MGNSPSHLGVPQSHLGIFQSDLGNSTTGRSRAIKLQKLLGEINLELNTLHRALEATKDKSHADAAHEYAYTVLPQAEVLRQKCDAAEGMISDSRWTLPKYRELLFQN